MENSQTGFRKFVEFRDRPPPHCGSAPESNTAIFTVSLPLVVEHSEFSQPTGQEGLKCHYVKFHQTLDKPWQTY